MEEESGVRVDREKIENFCISIFTSLGSKDEKAQNSAHILVATDARGIGSHRVGRSWRNIAGNEVQITSFLAEQCTDKPVPVVHTFRSGSERLRKYEGLN